MNNNYRIIESTFGGIPFYEVRGSAFDYDDLYEMVGKNKFSTTFYLKNSQKLITNMEKNLRVIFITTKGTMII